MRPMSKYKSLRRADGLQEQVQREERLRRVAANLKAQGWTNDGMDMVQPQSSILKRSAAKRR